MGLIVSLVLYHAGLFVGGIICGGIIISFENFGKLVLKMDVARTLSDVNFVQYTTFNDHICVVCVLCLMMTLHNIMHTLCTAPVPHHTKIWHTKFWYGGLFVGEIIISSGRYHGGLFVGGDYYFVRKFWKFGTENGRR